MMQLFGEADREYRKAFLLNPLVDLRLLGKADEHGDRLAFRVSGNRVFVLDLWWRPEYAKALNLIQDARYGDAFTKLDGLLRAPKAGTDGANLPDGVIWYHGLVCAHLGRWDEAIHSMAVLTGRAIASEQSDEITAIPLRANEYRYALGTMYFLGGEPEKAIAVFHRALEFDAGLYVAHVQLARIYEAARHWDEAVQERQLAVELNPDDPTLLVDLGGTLAAAGRPADADSVLAAAESANPRDARASYLHALAAERAGRGAEAHDAFTRFLAIAPSSLAEQITEAKRHLAAAP
jgi:Tfp pilus assembly protein PilF